MNKLYFLIGASGSGKTSLLRSLEKEGWPAKIFYFDSIGVSLIDEMIKEFGSQEEWQRIKTGDWIKKIKKELLANTDVILDAQTRPAFIEEACLENNVSNFKIILIDCEDKIRKKRLNRRGQPNLADEKMMNWAKFLREDCQLRKCVIFDNSNLDLTNSLLELKKILADK